MAGEAVILHKRGERCWKDLSTYRGGCAGGPSRKFMMSAARNAAGARPSNLEKSARIPAASTERNLRWKSVKPCRRTVRNAEEGWKSGESRSFCGIKIATALPVTPEARQSPKDPRKSGPSYCNLTPGDVFFKIKHGKTYPDENRKENVMAENEDRELKKIQKEIKQLLQ